MIFCECPEPTSPAPSFPLPTTICPDRSLFETSRGMTISPGVSIAGTVSVPRGWKIPRPAYATLRLGEITVPRAAYDVEATPPLDIAGTPPPVDPKKPIDSIIFRMIA